jgi:hypothetical protein
MYDLNHETDLFEMLRVKVECNKFYFILRFYLKVQKALFFNRVSFVF